MHTCTRTTTAVVVVVLVCIPHSPPPPFLHPLSLSLPRPTYISLTPSFHALMAQFNVRRVPGYSTLSRGTPISLLLSTSHTLNPSAQSALAFGCAPYRLTLSIGEAHPLLVLFLPSYVNRMFRQTNQFVYIIV